MEQTRAEAAEPAITKADLGRAVVGFVDELAKAIPESVVDFIGRVAEAARDPENLAKLQAGITMVADIIETELERYDRDPRSFLYDEMLAGPAVLLIAK